MRKNSSVALNLAILALGMLAMAYASVPLYRLFCQKTGYGGTTQEGKFTPGQALGRDITVEFNADTDPHLPWEFKPGQHKITIKIGEKAMTYYTAKNLSDQPITGRAVYNVVPFAMGPYFVKVECFCFKEQTLAPHQSVQMPVVFYIDAGAASDPDLKDVQTVTLSYTFFPAAGVKKN